MTRADAPQKNTDEHGTSVGFSTYPWLDRLVRSSTTRVLRAENTNAPRWRIRCSCSGVDDRNECALPHSDITKRIIAAFYAVHRELGYGFSENLYRRAVSIVMRDEGLEAIEEQSITVSFRGTLIGSFNADIVVGRVVLVEVKAAAAIEDYAQSQILNYLKAAGGGVGLLLNFGRQASFKRFVMGDPANSLPALRAQAP